MGKRAQEEVEVVVVEATVFFPLGFSVLGDLAFLGDSLVLGLVVVVFFGDDLDRVDDDDDEEEDEDDFLGLTTFFLVAVDDEEEGFLALVVVVVAFLGEDVVVLRAAFLTGLFEASLFLFVDLDFSGVDGALVVDSVLPDEDVVVEDFLADFLGEEGDFFLSFLRIGLSL